MFGLVAFLDLLANLVIKQEAGLIEQDVHVLFQLLVAHFESEVVLGLVDLVLALGQVLDDRFIVLINRRGPL